MIARPWTDDLPKCENTSVGQYLSRLGVSSNASEDNLCFYCQVEDDSYLYGVFDPHNGVEAARFVLQRMAADIMFYQLTPSSTDEEIRDLLRNAFLSVEKAYVENYDGMIAERTSLQYQLQTLHNTQISQNCDNILSRLKEIDQHLSGGATVVIALTHRGRLFVANVGCARALLCRTDENSVLRVVQLSAEHSLHNEDELLRLESLGLRGDKLRQAQSLGNQAGTRCLGNYLVKGLYRAFPDLKAAVAEPVIPTPEIPPPIHLDDSCRFLVLVSSGVYRRLEEVKGSSEQTNKELAAIIVENFRKTTDFAALGQAVLTEIEDQFITYCMKHSLTPKPNSHMTLLIRNFNFPLPNVQKPRLPAVDAAQGLKSQAGLVRFNPIIQSKSHTLLNDIDSEIYTNSPSTHLTNESHVSTNRTASTESSSDIYTSGRLPYDKDRRIKGYVDFSCYYENVEKARKNGTLPSFIK